MEPDKINESTEQKEKKRGGVGYLAVILILLCTNLVLCYFLWKEKSNVVVITVEKEKIVSDAERVKQELQALQEGYENMKVNNKQMQAEIDAKKEEIAQMQKELEKHKDDAYIIARLKKETKTLRDIMQHFVHEIDSLNTMNKKVFADKKVVESKLDTALQVNQELNKAKTDLENTVKIASTLKAVGVKAVGVHSRGTKESDTKRAKRANKIKLTFTLAENRVSKTGEHIVYARIITPDGKEMSQGTDTTNMFRFGASRGFWATKKAVNYTNEDTDVTMYAHTKNGEELLPGKYIIEISADEAVIGSTSLVLD